MPWSETSPQFSTVATVIGLVLFAYVAVGEPLLGRRAFAWLRRRRDTEPHALTRFYWLTLSIEWAWAVAIVAALLLSPDVAAADLGLRLPDSWSPLLAGAAGFTAAFLAVSLVGRLRPGGWKDQAGTDESTPAQQVAAVVTPRSRAESRLAVAVSTTAGICEELLYRAFLPVLGTSLGLPLWLAAAIAAALFALAHIYQGWWGLVGPGLIGALLTVLYLGTGSLLVPVVAHVALDMRALLLPRVGRRRGRRRGRPRRLARL